MRRRSTFVHDPALDVDPEQLHVSGDKFVVEDLEAAREERLIFPLEKLPDEVISRGSLRRGNDPLITHISLVAACS